MSTRCMIHFQSQRDGEPDALIYRHSDGYPEGVLPDLERFFEAVEEQTRDTRFTDPEYLAAKYVVWQASEYARNGNPLDFLSVGVAVRDHGDIEWRYHVICAGFGSNEYPTVEYEATR